LLALGRLCVKLRLWGQARKHLERSIALAPSAGAWEALAEMWTGQGDAAMAQRCYRNALALTRGDSVQNVPTASVGAIDTRPIAIEDRNEHGVPRLRE
jgi:HemY protein